VIRRVPLGSCRGLLFLWLAATSPGAGWASPLPEPGLRKVPRPALEYFEAAERSQLEGARAGLDAVLGDPEVEVERLAQAYGDLGRFYLLYDLVIPAEAALANAATLAPRELAWRYYLGVLAQREGRLDEAIRHLDRAVELRPEDLPARLRLGEAQVDAGRPREAEVTYRAALELDPESAAAEVGLGRVAYDAGRTEEAIERFRRALELQPRADTIHYRLGLAYRRLGDREAAREHLARNRGEPVRFEDPLVDGLTGLLQGSAIHLQQGNDLMARGAWDLAVEAYGRAAARSPDDPLIQHNLGLALARAGRRSEAIERFRRAVTLDPEYRDAHYNLATALAEEGLWEEAADNYDRVWRIDPLDASARLDWALALRRAGEEDRAVEELTALVETVGAEGRTAAGRAHLALGAILEERGRREEALQGYLAAAERLPEDVEVHATLAAALGRSGELARAAEEYAVASRLDPLDPEHRFGRGMALILDGRHAEARRWLEESLAALAEEDDDASRPLAHLLARLLATAPEPAARDGARALALARQVFQAVPSPEHAETLAMALAETGDFAGAAEWQRRVLARAEAGGAPPGVLDTVRARLARYERGEAVRSPWEGS
jgi:tetratricopeptide (TPR) repeat protein